MSEFCFANNDDGSREKFIERVLKYLDGQACEAELDQLNEELAGDPGKRQIYIMICRDSQFIHESQVVDGDEKIAEIRYRGALDELAGLGRKRRGIWTKPVIGFALAASVAFAAALFAILSGGSQQREIVEVVTVARPAVATLADAVDVKWHAQQPPLQVGAELTSGVLRLEEGFVRLETERGVSITLQGPAEFELETAALTRLRQGRLTAEVSRKGRGFIVETEALNLADLGTAFGVEVDGEETAVVVFEGEVEVDKPSETGSTSARTLLKAGGAVVSEMNSSEVAATLFAGVAKRFERSRQLTSGVMKLAGDAVYHAPGATLDPYRYGDSVWTLVLPERREIEVQEDLNVDLTEPGKYSRFFDQRSGVIEAGEEGVVLDSFLVQFNRNLNIKPKKRALRGTVRFTREVAGIIVSAAKLQHTDSMFGQPSDGDGADYLARRAAGTSSEFRGLDAGDVLELSGDRKTLSFKLKPGQDRDQIRVLLLR